MKSTFGHVAATTFAILNRGYRYVRFTSYALIMGKQQVHWHTVIKLMPLMI